MGLFSLFKKVDKIYFPGCVGFYKNKENIELYRKILLKLGINLIELDKKICCGLPALEAGYEQEARKLARKNFEEFKKQEVEEIITTSPCCYKMFTQDYPELLPDWNRKVQNIWEIILEKLENRPGLIKNKPMELVTYHDSCYLGRYCNIYNAPRRILELIGYEIQEMPDSKEEAICCGSCGGLTISDPELASKIAKERILQAKRIKVKKIIVPSLKNYELLKENIDKEIEIIDFSEALALALGIKKKPSEEIKEEKISGEKQILLDKESNAQLEEELKEEDYDDLGDEE